MVAACITQCNGKTPGLVCGGSDLIGRVDGCSRHRGRLLAVLILRLASPPPPLPHTQLDLGG
eukprot:COSAG01_NODE_523_length_15948_cov_161.993690_13_plen_62_part_00